MIGAILTGGYGKRMQGLSQDKPKTPAAEEWINCT